MATSSKKEIDLLVRLGVLEKLVDKLVDRLANVESSTKGTETHIRDMLSIVSNLQEQKDEPWEVPNPPTSEGEKIDPQANDEVSHLVDA